MCQLASHHCGNHLLLRHGISRRGTNVPAVPKDGNAVSNRKDFRQSVRNIDHYHATGSERSYDFQEANHFSFVQRSCRFIHDNDARLSRESPSNLDELLLADRKFADQSARVDIEIQRVQNLYRISVHRLPIDEWSTSRLPGHENILGDAKMGQQTEFLKNYTDATALRTQRVGEHNGSSINQ